MKYGDGLPTTLFYQEFTLIAECYDTHERPKDGFGNAHSLALKAIRMNVSKDAIPPTAKTT